MRNKITSIFIVLVLFVLATLPYNVQAQIQPYIFRTTMPVNADLRSAIDMWLVENNPSNGIYYVITYAQVLSEGGYYASIASININSPDETWSMTEDENGISKLIWLGTVRVYPDLSVELITERQAQSRNLELVSLTLPADLLAAGGGPEIRFPFQDGYSVMYGPRAVHNAGYSTTGAGMSAIDLVGGQDFGVGGANDLVYASYGGTIDFVCADGTTNMIRVNDGGNKFIYAQMLENAALELNRVFVKGEVIGSLKHGAYNDDCGYADQSDHHWHLHWGFQPANNAYRVEDCTINTRTNSITCGSKVVNPGGYLTSNGGASAGYDDGGSNSNPTFWDYLLVGFVSIFDRGIIKLLPEHTSPTLLPRVIFNTLRFTLDITYAMLVSNFNLGPSMSAIFLALSFRILIGTIWLIGAIFRTVKLMPGA